MSPARDFPRRGFGQHVDHHGCWFHDYICTGVVAHLLPGRLRGHARPSLRGAVRVWNRQRQGTCDMDVLHRAMYVMGQGFCLDRKPGFEKDSR